MALLYLRHRRKRCLTAKINFLKKKSIEIDLEYRMVKH